MQWMIELTRSEKKLLDGLRFDPKETSGPEDFRRNGITACELTKSLLQRDAVPMRRLAYFTNPTCNTGRGRGSIKQEFERDGLYRDNIYTEYTFLPILKFFICGADLPEIVRNEFLQHIHEIGYVTSSDVQSIKKCARKLARQYRLTGMTGAEEFLKLALDCGLSPSCSMFVRQAVMQVR